MYNWRDIYIFKSNIYPNGRSLHYDLTLQRIINGLLGIQTS